VAREGFKIAVLPGDGIGPEVVSACLEVLDAVRDAVGGVSLEYDSLEAGAALYTLTGESLPVETLRRAGEADAVLLGAMGMPDIRYPDGTEIAPQLDLRERFELFAGVRPVKTFAGLPLPLADPRAAEIDFVIVRESTEGLFAARGRTVREGDRAVRDTMVITREASERLFHYAFRLARRRKEQGRPGTVTLVDKANVLGAFAFFRGIFDECARQYPDVEAQRSYVDATGLNFVKKPWDFDVLVTENMFGDILSDVAAGLVGGMGLAPSGDIGEEHAVFQPCHGSAPDIAGLGHANPVATLLSGAMMLEWLGERHDSPACDLGARLLRAAVGRAFAEGELVPFELGGDAGTEAITRRVLECVRSPETRREVEISKGSR
jgi:3-isopropylmalate dehydrogenase